MNQLLDLLKVRNILAIGTVVVCSIMVIHKGDIPNSYREITLMIIGGRLALAKPDEESKK